MIRTAWVWLNMLVVTGVLSSAVVVLGLLRIRSPFYEWVTRHWSRWMLRVSGVTVRMEGEENAPADQPRIYVCNHQSWYDVFALAATLPGHYRFVAKKELARIPIFGSAWKAAGHICVDRGDRESARRSLDEAGRLIRGDGSGVIIFAEGTRTADGRLQKFKKGAFMLALHTGVDLVPVGIIGSRAVQPKGAWRVRPGQITIRIGKPIPTGDYSFDTRDEMMRRTRSEIQQLVAPSIEAATATTHDNSTANR